MPSFFPEKYFIRYLSPRTELFTYMTARPHDPDCRRRPLQIAVALVLVIVAVLLAGCTSSNQYKVPLTPINYVITTLPTIQPQCPVKENTTPWITVNYSDNRQIEDLIKINGTTNIEKGELSIFFLEVAGHTCLNRGDVREGPCPCCEGVTVTAPIVSEVGGNNTWSTEVNTSQYGFYPAKFYMAVYSLDCRELDHYVVTMNITARSSPQYNSSEQQK
jgi:hypothetical protein